MVLDEGDIELPDILTELQDKTQLTRKSLATILRQSGRLGDFAKNPKIEESMKREVELILAILTPEQTTRWQELTGAPFQGKLPLFKGPGLFGPPR